MATKQQENNLNSKRNETRLEQNDHDSLEPAQQFSNRDENNSLKNEQHLKFYKFKESLEHVLNIDFFL